MLWLAMTIESIFLFFYLRVLPCFNPAHQQFRFWLFGIYWEFSEYFATKYNQSYPTESTESTKNTESKESTESTESTKRTESTESTVFDHLWLFKKKFLTVVDCFRSVLTFFFYTFFDRFWPYWPFVTVVEQFRPFWPFLTIIV